MINVENGAQVQNAVVKNKTYLNRENHYVFTLREIFGRTWNKTALKTPRYNKIWKKYSELGVKEIF